HGVRLFGGEHEAFAGEADGGRNHLGQGELAVGLLGVDQAGDGAGDRDGFRAEGGEAGDYVLLGGKVQVGGGGRGRLLGVVEEVSQTGVQADEHEASAAQV